MGEGRPISLRVFFLDTTYRKISKNLDTKNNFRNCPTTRTVFFFFFFFSPFLHAVMLLKDADGTANSINPDQTAP